MPPTQHTCTQVRVHVHRCTQTFVTGIHTHPFSSALTDAHTHYFPHTPSLNTRLNCIQTSLTKLPTHKHTPPPANTLCPAPPHLAHTLHPREPAPALLSTRDWPTRIRMLEAKMDRQKFSKMMERSDFMNL